MIFCTLNKRHYQEREGRVRNNNWLG
jgi:hypothetical protein